DLGEYDAARALGARRRREAGEHPQRALAGRERLQHQLAARLRILPEQGLLLLERPRERAAADRARHGGGERGVLRLGQELEELEGAVRGVDEVEASAVEAVDA